MNTKTLKFVPVSRLLKVNTLKPELFAGYKPYKVMSAVPPKAPRCSVWEIPVCYNLRGFSYMKPSDLAKRSLSMRVPAQVR